jgi:hypothetical protein
MMRGRGILWLLLGRSNGWDGYCVFLMGLAFGWKDLESLIVVPRNTKGCNGSQALKPG